MGGHGIPHPSCRIKESTTPEPTMTAILHLCAKNDYNGNPQRAYVLIDEDGPVAVWDEGYYGSDAVPGDFRKMAYDAERQEISVRKYKKLFKELPSPDYAYQVKGYAHLK